MKPYSFMFVLWFAARIADLIFGNQVSVVASLTLGIVLYLMVENDS